VPRARSPLSSLDLALVLASALLHAAWSAAIKGSRDPLAFNLVQKLFFGAGLLSLLPLVAWREVPPAVWRLTAATGVAHGLYFYWMSRSFERGDLTVVYPIVRSTPALLPFLAVAWLGESISPAGALGIAVVVAGVWLVHTRGDLRPRALVAPGTGFAYLTLLATVAYSLIDKQAMARLTEAPWSGPVPRSVVYFFLLTASNALVFVPLASRRVSWTGFRRAARSEWRQAALAVAMSVASYGLILEAYRRAPASYVVAVRQVSVLFAVAIGAVWLRERPGRARVLGAAATVAGVALIALFP
jgi:drug/metabolite transporter (DMT)-like permease